jgi:hypothetical protein
MDTLPQIDTLHAKQGHFYLIGCTARPGALRFATQLEYHHYTPETPLNDQYNIFHTIYNKTPFYIIEVPSTDRIQIDKLATKCNLKLVNGKPFAPGQDSFRLVCDGSLCFTLETLDHSILPHDLHTMMKKEYDEARNMMKLGLGI